nr:MAG: sugsr transporter [Pseudomonadota bacterium]
MASLPRPACVLVSRAIFSADEPRQEGRLGRRELLGLLLGLAALPACASRRGRQQVNLPPPSESSVLGPGDVFTLEIVGEKDLPKEYQVAADGTVDVPYVHTIRVAGLEAPEVARLVRKRLMEEKFLEDPSVIVQVKDYNSRRVTLLGQVAKPGSFPFTTGLTLIQAVSLAGGLTAIADGDRVNVTRKGSDGRTYTAVISVKAITEGESPDIPLQAGDQIFVHERIF